MSRGFLIASLLLASCGGSSRGFGGDGGGSPFGDLAGGGSSLAGRWELTATGSSTKGTLILDATSINVSIGSYIFLMHVNGAQADLTWQSPESGQIAVDVT